VDPEERTIFYIEEVDGCTIDSSPWPILTKTTSPFPRNLCSSGPTLEANMDTTTLVGHIKASNFTSVGHPLIESGIILISLAVIVASNIWTKISAIRLRHLYLCTVAPLAIEDRSQRSMRGVCCRKVSLVSKLACLRVPTSKVFKKYNILDSFTPDHLK
jgi:hypothetical protein